MKTCTTEQEYINAIAPSAQKVCKRYGYLPSVLIAQSCLENGYGIPDYWDNPQIQTLLKYNNMVGIKSQLLNGSWNDKTVWTGQSLIKQTPEYYGGRATIITDNFRKYDTIERSFADFLLFLKYASNYGKGGQPKYGQKVLTIKDPEKLIKKVNSLGYATDSNYAISVMKIVNKHNLTKYDDLTKVKETVYTPGYAGTASKTDQTSSKQNESTAAKKLSKPKFIDNRSASKDQVPKWRDKSDIKYIVVHYLGVVGQNFELWDGGYGATFTIAWNGDVYWTADYTAVTWQCGGGRQGSGGGSVFGKCTNYNSVSIETCVKRTDNQYEGDDNDDKWYFTKESQESLVWAVSKLMDDLNIPIQNVVRHYDVTGKICPNPYVRNNGKNGNWTWTQFKNNLKQYRKDGTINSNGEASTKAEDEKWYRIREAWKDESSQIGAYKDLEEAKKACPTGYSIFDWNGKIVYENKAEIAKEQTKTSSSTTKTKTTTLTVSVTRNKFVDAAENVYLLANQNKWKYGDSHSIPPCEDKKISCDRLEARALYDLGYTDQREGGQTCGTLSNWLPKHGWVKITSKSKIKPGAIVAVKDKNSSYIDHIFTIVSYNKNTDLCTKYDTGSNERINSKQPFEKVKLIEWSNRVFVCAWNPPSDMTVTRKVTGKYNANKKTFADVDYSAVYSYSYYKNKYEDLREAYGDNKEEYFKHFCQYGMKEGRIAKSSFNVKKYKERYEDLRKNYGSDLMEYYRHYCLWGKEEGRKGN